MPKYRRNTKRFLITELLENGMGTDATYEALRPMVESQSPPMIFTANNPVKGLPRIPKSISQQLIDLRYEINRVAASLNIEIETATAPFEPVAVETEIEPSATPEIEATVEESADEKEETKPVASGKSKLADAKAFFLAEVRRIREFCNSRELAGDSVDAISMRPVEAGARLLPAGIPPQALLHAMTIHWSSDSRNAAGIADFNVEALSAEIMADRGITEVKRSNGKTEMPHKLFGYCLTLVENRQPVMAIGPAGTGKSHLAKQIADYIGCNYAECPMTPGATRGDLLGRHTIGGFITAEFVNIYSGGGIFNFEEIDAADPSMLLVLNNALASDALYNPVNGEQYDKSESLSAFSTANTFGMGANRAYTGRERLDAATIDRWRMGRVVVGIDENVENSILGV